MCPAWRFAQLRKPAVEKRRRDRINTGIERLKLLLKNDLNPNSKLEKAHVLETAVVYLKKSKAGARASLEQCYADGVARCLEETARFLVTVHHPEETYTMLRTLSSHAIHPKATGSSSVGLSDNKSAPECPGAVWRPW